MSEVKEDSLPVEVIVRFRARRLNAIVVSMFVVAALAFGALLLPWWTFSSPAMQMQVRDGASGFRYVDLAASTAVLSGRDAGGWVSAAVLAAAALSVSLAAIRRLWFVCWPLMLVLMPKGVVWPSSSPPPSVAGKMTAAASMTSATPAVTLVTVLFCAQLALVVLAGVQMFLTRRAERVASGDASMPEKTQGLIERYVAAALERVLPQQADG